MKKNVKKGETAKKQGIGGGSFIAAGIVVTLIPAIFYIIFGDFVVLLQNCGPLSSTIDIDGIFINCIELRFVYVLSYFCIFFGLILIIWGLAKKIIEARK